MKKTLLLFIICFLSNSCEKDDICDANTPTTPKLVIDFYDATTNTAKNVTNLTIYEFGNTAALTTFDNVSEIKIPLKTTANSVKYRFILNNTTPTTAITNEDILEFNYTRENVFVSRACGYKTIYKLNAGTPTKTDPLAVPNYWIQTLAVQTTSINNENEIHIKIKFN
jgi:Family of unknown function (DUF6452)